MITQISAMSRFLSLSGMLVLLAFLTAAPSGCKSEKETAATSEPVEQRQMSGNPNILFIVMDDMNDYTGYLGGHPQAETPNIDALAAAGMAFTQAYCNAPLCAPSRTSFMTGKLPTFTGILNNPQYYDRISKPKRFRNVFGGSNDVYTLPQWLKDEGDYYTVGIGKILHGWTTAGYDADFDRSGSNCNRGLSWNDFIDFPVKEEPVPSNPGYEDGLLVPGGRIPDSREKDMVDTKGVNEAVDILTDYSRNPSRFCDKPLFMAVGLWKPHGPLYIPERYYPEGYNPDPFDAPEMALRQMPASGKADGIVLAPRPADGQSDFKKLPQLGKMMAKKQKDRGFDRWAQKLGKVPNGYGRDEGMRKLSDWKRAQQTAAYLAAINYADAQVGRLLQSLEENGMAENTVVVLVSDHGFSLGERQHWAKRALWDTDIRIPYIIRDPRRGSGTCSKPVSLVDLFPTISELAGVDQPSGYLDGRSIVPLLDNPDQNWNEPVLTGIQMTEDAKDGGRYPAWSVRDESYHYIQYKSDAGQIQEELYHVGEMRTKDPEEWNNLARNNSFRSEKDRLSGYIPK